MKEIAKAFLEKVFGIKEEVGKIDILRKSRRKIAVVELKDQKIKQRIM